jgi:hypothetical protein
VSDVEDHMNGAVDLQKLQRGALVLGTDLEIGALESVRVALARDPSYFADGFTLLLEHVTGG